MRVLNECQGHGKLVGLLDTYLPSQNSGFSRLRLSVHFYPLTLSQTLSLVFTCLQYKSFENTVGKGEIAHNEQFLLFPQCFLPVL